MTMTATSSSEANCWNANLVPASVTQLEAAFLHQEQQQQQQQQHEQQLLYPAQVSAVAAATGASPCLYTFCSPCSCAYCQPQRHHHQHHQQHHHPHISPSFHEQQQQQQQQHTQMAPWGAGNSHCFALPRGSPFGTVPNPITGDHGSSDEALSPPHQDDPLDDIMDVKEASRLQQDIVKSWKQKKRASCEMKTRTQDKYRQVYNSHQRFELEKEFHYQKYISTARKSELSGTLHLSERQIKIWFQNRRAKERRQKKNSSAKQTASAADAGAASKREPVSPQQVASFAQHEFDVKQELA